MSAPGAALPAGYLVSWYGDDFTGSAAVMEVLTFAGLPAVLFLQLPTPDQLADFVGYRACGIAGTARSRSPQWMDDHLPAVFRFLAGTGSPIVHYKICSTLDSSPRIGSIGKAIDIAAPIFDSKWVLLLVAAPPMHRYQAFGNLFASVNGVGYRLDRHPTMSRHPATPMDEADVRLHLSHQTSGKLGLVDFVAMTNGGAQAAIAEEVENGATIIALDAVDDRSLRSCGQLLWENRASARFAVGSQGIEYALVAHWQAESLIDPPAMPPTADAVDRIAVVSGSCAPETAGQIRCAADHGFQLIRVDATRAVDPQEWLNEIEKSVAAALSTAGEGRDPLLYTALGPDDPALAAFNNSVGENNRDRITERLGTGLGTMLDQILRATNIQRCVVAGGDTSGHATRALGIHALTALAYTAPGACLTKAHCNDPAYADLEIALKGGQMGSPEYFIDIKQGGRCAS